MILGIGSKLISHFFNYLNKKKRQTMLLDLRLTIDSRDVDRDVGNPIGSDCYRIGSAGTDGPKAPSYNSDFQRRFTF
jgi:hypothetical protein